MKELNIFNGEEKAITIVTDLETVVIPGKSNEVVKMGIDAEWNTGDFYVEEEGNWYAKKWGATGTCLEIYNAGE